ncbi:MAG: hypothetical protein JNM09_18110 [Blastocatellia bacterium]|nr:hypothetical protein [Blastocatellia bacterium]
MLKRFTVLFALMLFAITSATAQNGAAPAAKAAAAPTVDEILDKYVKALGGKEAIEKVSSRVGKGTMELEGMGLSGPVEMYAKAPNKNAMFIELQGVGKIVNVYDGEKGYALSPMEGVSELSGGALAQAKRNADFYEPLNIKKHFAKMEVKGQEKVAATDAYVVVATPAVGDPEKLYFAVDSGLLVRIDSDNDTPQGKMSFETYISDYKDVDGIKVAHTLRQVSSAFTALIKMSEVKHGVTVEDAKFAKPSGQ